MLPVTAGEMPGRAAGYHEALRKRPESEALFQRFRDAWLEEKPAAELEAELLERAEAGEAGAWAILGREWLAAGKEEEALSAFGKAIAAEPTAAWLRLARAKLLVAKKDFAAAEKDALAVPPRDKQMPEALKLAGLACLRADRVDEALAHWKKAVDSAPGDKGLLEDLTELTRREGRYDLALDYCAKWQDATDDAYVKAMATLKKAELLLSSGRLDESVAELGNVLAKSGDGSWLEREALARAEQSYQRRGDTLGWVTQITTWAGVHPARLNLRRAQAQALALAGRTGEALTVLDEVLKRSPGDRDARWQRVSLLERDMQVQQAYDECALISAEEKSEEGGLRLADLAFRLDKKDEVKKALDGVIAAADPARKVGLAGLYARYGLPAESEKQWRAAATGESGGQALRELAKHLRSTRREKDALDVWREIGRRDSSQDRIDAAHALAGAGEKDAARTLLEEVRERFSGETNFQTARADIAMMQDRHDEARAIYRELASGATRPDELQVAVNGWLRAVERHREDALKDLAETTGDRCLRAALVAESGKPLPALVPGDALEREMRLRLLREHSKWPELVAMLEASGGTSPAYHAELLDAKSAAGDQAGALAVARAWRERSPDMPGPWMKEASLLAAAGNVEDGVALLRRAAARFDADEDVARALFSLLARDADGSGALELAWQFHDKSDDPAIRSGWLREIIRLSMDGDRLSDLKARLEERVRRDPASPGPLVALADLAGASGEREQELEMLVKAVAGSPRDVALVSRLARLEEKHGRRDRALARYEELVRLVPGMESARQHALAKLRCGDIRGGMRDLKALLVGDALDLRELEQSVLTTALRGYIGEAIALLESLDPAILDARAHFIMGMLLEADGREAEALDHFVKVMAEPPDPAESQYPEGIGLGVIEYLQHIRLQRRSGVDLLRSVAIPSSLAEAKRQLPARMIRLAMVCEEGAWEKIGAVIPGLRSSSVEDWRQVDAVIVESGYRLNFDALAFLDRFPANPLGAELLLNGQQIRTLKPAQIDSLLQRQPPVPANLGLFLRLQKGSYDDATLAWLEQLDAATWGEPFAGAQLLTASQALMTNLEGAEEVDRAEVVKLDRMISLLDKAERGQEPDLVMQRHVLRARHAIFEGREDDFLASLQLSLGGNQVVEDVVMGANLVGIGPALARWEKAKGRAAVDSLIARIQSPVLRCLAWEGMGRDGLRQKIDKELAALPADAPSGQKSGLIRLKLRHWDRKADPAGLERELRKISADDSEPRLALEALSMLLQHGQVQGRMREPTPEEMQRAGVLMKRVPSHNLPRGPVINSQVGRQRGFMRAVPVSQATGRWGAPSHLASFISGPAIQSSQINRISSMGDKEAAIREATDLLWEAALGAMTGAATVDQLIQPFGKAGILNRAIERMTLPEDAGLTRRMALLDLLDAVKNEERALAIVTDLRKRRPWETRWSAELAMRTSDRAEAFRELDEISSRPDFWTEVRDVISDKRSRENLSRFTLLADWAERPGVDLSWSGQAVVALAENLSRSGGDTVLRKELYDRFCKLALTHPKSAEAAFRSMYSTRNASEPAVVEDAARRALLSGAYAVNFGSPDLMQRMQNAPASIELLVQAAGERGDDAVFPPAFMESLKAVDPEMAGWLATFLSTKRATDFPGLFDNGGDTYRENDVPFAKHGAEMMRAARLPGRDKLLEKMFREKKVHSVSRALSLVIRQSLMDADKDKSIDKQILTWLEYAAGPRKGWDLSGEDRTLPMAATAILGAAATLDSATYVSVLKLFASWKLQLSSSNPANDLARLWQAELAGPAKEKWELLPGTGLRDALQLGQWQTITLPGESEPRLRFSWIFADAVHRVPRQTAQQVDEAARVMNDEDASFTEVIRVMRFSQDRELSKKAVKLAAPELAKLPAEVREGVLRRLTVGLSERDLRDLPKQATEMLGKRLDEDREKRVRAVRQSFDQMKATGQAPKNGVDVGQLVGPIAADDKKLAAEIIAFWRSAKGKGDASKEFSSFMSGYLQYGGRDPDALFDSLMVAEELWGAPIPPAEATHEDPFLRVWSQFSGGPGISPDTWGRIAKLSARMQLRVLLPVRRNFHLARRQDEEWITASTKAADASPLTRHTLGWLLDIETLNRDSKSRSSGLHAVGLVEAMKAAGATPDELAMIVEDIFRKLSRMDNAAEIMKQTPQWLAGLKVLPETSGDEMANGVLELWSSVQYPRRNPAANAPGATPPPPVHPAETAAVLRFVLAKLHQGKFKRIFPPAQVSSLLIALDDDELITRWGAASRMGLAGDTDLMLHLLRKDRVKEAISLLPGEGASMRPHYSSTRRFSTETEGLIGKLAALDSKEAFQLRVILSGILDDQDDRKPSVLREQRLEKLAEEYEKRRTTFSARDRMMLCQNLDLIQKAVGEHVPALDEFAGEQVTRAFQGAFAARDAGNPAREEGAMSWSFALAVAQSRLHAGDASGIESFAKAIREAPRDGRSDAYVQPMVIHASHGFWAMANRLDAIIPAELATVMRTVAAAAATYSDPVIRAEAALLVHLASPDEASLKAGLDACKLANMTPQQIVDASRMRRGMEPRSLPMLRVGVLHPRSKELKPLVDRSRSPMLHSGLILLLLDDPKVRARMEPETFLEMTRFTPGTSAKSHQGIEKYIAERGDDFDAEQKVRLEQLQARIKEPGGKLDMEARKQLMELQREEMRRSQEDMRRRAMEGLPGMDR
ncbi:hypothetical protein OKA04_13045 [Luteolibacter flavescens]|uniref:Tetratricopeptide repeat protein n=1 Tax=Luteolibacter flavescens TaxID=1859460 RepID=A0ABT3FQT0_9BACT|nr:hypothetical protein [Luteolibacter flavescens]MCW1885659.1 hypothetical protein [Luteolibacter flavescens]